MITDNHGMIEKNLFKETSSPITTTTTTGIFIVRGTMGYQFVMTVRIILIYSNGKTELLCF